jgi:two-component system, sensor histidine kinase and response regulator
MNDMIYNEGEFLHRILDDRELAKVIIAKFLEDFPEKMEKLTQAVGAGSSEDIRKIAHSIKGTTANIAAKNLSSAAARLEECAENGDLETAPGLLDQIETEFERLKNILK